MGKYTLIFGGKMDESNMEAMEVDEAAAKDAMEERKKP